MAGWLLTTPNPKYNRITGGIKFDNGQAFLDLAIVIDRYVVRRPPINQLMVMMDSEQMGAWRGYYLKTAERAAKLIAADFHYQISFVP